MVACTINVTLGICCSYHVAPLSVVDGALSAYSPASIKILPGCGQLSLSEEKTYRHTYNV